MAICVPNAQNPKLTAALPVGQSRISHCFQEPDSTGDGTMNSNQTPGVQHQASLRLCRLRQDHHNSTCMTELFARQAQCVPAKSQ